MASSSSSSTASRKRPAPELLQNYAVQALASISCSKKLKLLTESTRLTIETEFAMALQMRYQELHDFLSEKISPRSTKTRLVLFLQEMSVEERQKLTAHIYYEAHRADRRDDFDMSFKLSELLYTAIQEWPQTTERAEVLLMEPFSRQGLNFVFDGVRAPHESRFVTLYFGYFEARWMPVVGMLRDAFVPDKRPVLWTDEFHYVEYRNLQQRFSAPDELFPRVVEPAEDDDFNGSEWLMAALGGVAQACNEKRYPLALALGFRLMEKCQDCPLLYGSFSCDIWGFMAEACAALNPAQPEEALLCLMRMKQCALVPSDFHAIRLAEAKIMQYFERDISVMFYRAKNDPRLIRQSEYFLKILITHLQNLVMQCEDCFLGYIREALYHVDCQDGLELCQERRSKIRNGLRLNIREMMTLLENNGMLMSIDRWPPLQVYYVLAKIMKVFLNNISYHEDGNVFDSTKLLRLVGKIMDLREKWDYDWHVTYIYYSLATEWVLNQNMTQYYTDVGSLLESMTQHLGQTESIVHCQMNYSAMVFMLMAQPHHENILNVDENLIHDVYQRYMTTPGQKPISSNFRGQLTLEVYHQLIFPLAKHNATEEVIEADQFWETNPFPWLTEEVKLKADTEKDYLQTYLDDTRNKDLCMMDYLRQHDKEDHILRDAERFGLEMLGKQRFF
jgi:hypothetical protein